MKKTDEELREIVSQSRSFLDVVRRAGYSINSGASYGHVKNRVKKLNCDTSHFTGKGSNSVLNYNSTVKKSWQELLVLRRDNLRENNHQLRRAFREYCTEVGIPLVCVGCNNHGEWRGKRLRIQVSHIDDNRSNNVPSNLEWLCPNCHDIK